MKLLKTSISVIMLAALLSVFAINAAADPDPIPLIQTGKEVTLTLQYQLGDEVIPDAEFRLYRVGDVTKGGAYRVNSPFYEVYDPKDDWPDIVSKMLSQVSVKNVAPYRVGTTDSNGVVVFKTEEHDPPQENDHLRTGLYLVESLPLELENEDSYIATSFLVMLPTFDGKSHDGEQPVWDYDVLIAPKARYTGNHYEVRFWDNHDKIGVQSSDITGMPVNFEFKRDSRYLTHRDNPLVKYSRNSSGDTQEKNSYELPYAEPHVEGYEFLGWNEDSEADEGYSTVHYLPEKRVYNIYAIWGSPDTPTPSSSTPSSATPSSATPTGANPTGANPTGANPTGANPTGANPTGANPTGANPTGANPTGANPTGANPTGANPTGANPTGKSTTPTTAAPKDTQTDTQKKDPILPQTGMLWWPVPVLAVFGFALFLLGVFAGRRKKDKSSVSKTDSSILLIAGILLVTSSLVLVLYNGWDDMRAGSETAEERAMIVRVIPGPDGNTDKSSEISCDNVESMIQMPVKSIQGDQFSAMLNIPALSLELPVRDKWSYPGLRRSPCRYTGSAYTDDLVICGHNYSAHFGNIKRLAKGDEVTLTTMNGDVFRYRVEEVTELSPSAIGEMIHSDYDLTLFTCTIGGRSRVTVRCRMVSLQPHDRKVVHSEYAFF